MSPAAQVTEAYRHCEAVTRAQARNFSYGIRLLPAPKRRALSAVYAFARRVDDIGDGELSRRHKLDELARARAEVHAASVADTDPVLVALADAAARMPLPMHAFDELIDGCEADVHGARYRTFDELRRYCQCVAGSIGRLSLGVFAAGDATGPERIATWEADVLGIALQLTNILRDVLEDRRNGRIYLPQDDLERFGVRLELTDEHQLDADPVSYAALVRFEADRAEGCYADGLRLLSRLDRRSRACAAAMAGIYHRLLDRIAAEPQHTMRGRVSLPATQKATVAARCLIGARP